MNENKLFKKIVMGCFYYNETNCGDKSYVETFLFLFKKYGENLKIDICDFYARSPIIQKTFANQKTIAYRIWRRIKNVFFHTRLFKYKKIKDYYKDKLDGADVLLIPGGGLVEYSSWRDYYYLMEMLEDICSKRNIPILINSIGYVENENPKRWIHRWKKVLNHPCVKFFTCRDNLAFFRELNPNVQQIPCVACLAAELFNIERDENSNKIGIGLMRPDAYDDYGNDFSKDFLIDYYKQVVNVFLDDGFEVVLFSNGVVRDHSFGKLLIQAINKEDVSIYERPKTVEAFLRQVASFKGILTVRTHSAYAAYSLNIPAVMIFFGKRGWQGKSHEFMKMMGKDENAVACDDVKPGELAQKFYRALSEGWSVEDRRNKLKETYDNFFRILRIINTEC